MKHPFARNQFTINTLDDVQKIIGTGIQSVKIDTDRGISSIHEKDKDKAKTTHRNNVSKPLNKPDSSLKKNRKAAKKIKSHAEQAMSMMP